MQSLNGSRRGGGLFRWYCQINVMKEQKDKVEKMNPFPDVVDERRLNSCPG
jgi:hypothetical protein